jgi:hypothetical protein
MMACDILRQYEKNRVGLPDGYGGCVFGSDGAEFAADDGSG